ncbi:MAG: 6-bladed beta-propeller [Candidatus Binatia bacterium]
MTNPDRKRFDCWTRAIGGAVGVCILTLFAGCDHLRPQPDAAASRPRLMWPAPPERERIELVQIFRAPSELGIRRSFWRRLGGLITGGRESHLVRPAGVAAAGNLIAVADTGGGILDLYDLERHRFRAVSACGNAELREPVAAAFLNDRLYVADAGTARIEIFDREGECAGGWQLDEGSRPAGLVADSTRGRLYVADPGAHQVLVFDATGAVTARIGHRGTGPGEFNYPGWLALDARGRLYVTDALNFRIQIFEPDGTLISTFGHLGDGTGDFARPKGVGIDRDGHVYVVDALFDAVQIFDAHGSYLLGFGQHGTREGQFWLPSGLTIDGDRIYVVDSYNQRVQVFRYLGGSE